jgi:hypothetical protein
MPGFFIWLLIVLDKNRIKWYNSHMSKTAFVGGVMAGAMLVGGCSPRHSTPEINFHDTGTSAAPAPQFTAPELQVPQLPDKLPQPIADVAKRAVSIQVGAVMNQGSGVRYDSDTVITAGHVVSNEQTHQLLPSLKRNCENLQANAQGGKYGVGAAHNKVAAIYNESTDVAAFSLSPLINSMPRKAAPLDVATTPPKQGDALYFVNYEPTANDEMRSPEAETPAFRKPAIYGGVVVHNTIGDPTQTVEVLTYKSYGEKPDSVSRPGASGGAVFKIQGGKAVLVGEVSLAVREGFATTPEEVAGKIGQMPKGVPQDVELGLSGVQMVTPDTVQTLQYKLHEAPACKLPDF